MRVAFAPSIRLQILTVMIAAGILMALAPSEFIVRGQPPTIAQFGMALAGIGACLVIGAQIARRRSEP